jgi:hypothetical protein
LLCTCVILLQGCDLRERETALEQQKAALDEREQQLLLREKTVELREAELAKQQAIDTLRQDTIRRDTTAIINPALVGTWSVQMTCTETTCAGSAVGDTKTETWELSYQGMNVIAQAKANNELVRVYTGTYNGNTLELLGEAETVAQSAATKIIVRLQLVKDNELSGQREIDRLSDQCRIVYNIKMEKK